MPYETPKDELARLKKELEDKQDDTSELAKQVDLLKAQIADLSKTVDDIDQKTSAYEKAAGAAGDQVKDFTAYVKTEKTMLKAALPASAVTEVEDKKKAALKDLDDLKTALKDATKKAGDEDKAYGTAKVATTAAQAAYKAIADLPVANANAINDLKGLRAAADKQGAANSLGRQYFLVLIMEDRLATIKVLTPEEYENQLNDAGKALDSASKAQTSAKDKLELAVADQKQAQKNLDDKRAKWRQETLDQIPATPSAKAANGAKTTEGPEPSLAPAAAAPAR